MSTWWTNHEAKERSSFDSSKRICTTNSIINKCRPRPVTFSNMWMSFCKRLVRAALREANENESRNCFYFDITRDRCWTVRVWNYGSSHGNSWKTWGSLRCGKKAVCRLATKLRVQPTEPIRLRLFDIFISRLIYRTLWRLELLLVIDLSRCSYINLQFPLSMPVPDKLCRQWETNAQEI